MTRIREEEDNIQQHCHTHIHAYGQIALLLSPNVFSTGVKVPQERKLENESSYKSHF